MKRGFFLLFLFLGIVCMGIGPVYATYSIVAWDGEEMGVAVQSHWYSVGTVVSWAEPGVGAVATQSFAEIAYGPLGLDLLRAGFDPERALGTLLSRDDGRETRQVALVDRQGRVAVYTGKRCIAEAGHTTGEHFSVQANIMRRASVWPAMARAFRRSKGKRLAERLISALEAAQEEGVELRGRQSAALRVGRVNPVGPWGTHVTVDQRLGDTGRPVRVLWRIALVHRA